ncbi:MAG: acyl-CoA thioesterase [Candidatus Obscuribacterales bacterium]|nr:acyl-CoA thioesterase [Candidatus Obscuribacterales bacterium]
MTEKQKTTVCDTVEESYKHFVDVELRYGDTDRQGHINNAVFCTLFESGRVAFLYEDGQFIAGQGKSIVIAKLTLDYLKEMTFPGVCQIGSRVLSTGRSSIRIGQAIFKDGICTSTAESIVVLIDEATGKSTPLDGKTLAKLATFT